MKEVKADVSYGQENTGENFGTKLPPQHQSSDKIAPTSERSIMLKKLYDNIFLRQELSLIWNKTSGKKKTNWQKRGQNFIVSKKLYY